jgi:hypothetical protein
MAGPGPGLLVVVAVAHLSLAAWASAALGHRAVGAIMALAVTGIASAAVIEALYGTE